MRWCLDLCEGQWIMRTKSGQNDWVSLRKKVFYVKDMSWNQPGPKRSGSFHSGKIVRFENLFRIWKSLEIKNPTGFFALMWCMVLVAHLYSLTNLAAHWHLNKKNMCDHSHILSYPNSNTIAIKYLPDQPFHTLKFFKIRRSAKFVWYRNVIRLTLKLQSCERIDQVGCFQLIAWLSRRCPTLDWPNFRRLTYLQR